MWTNVGESPQQQRGLGSWQSGKDDRASDWWTAKRHQRLNYRKRPNTIHHMQQKITFRLELVRGFILNVGKQNQLVAIETSVSCRARCSRKQTFLQTQPNQHLSTSMYIVHGSKHKVHLQHNLQDYLEVSPKCRTPLLKHRKNCKTALFKSGNCM